MCRRSFFCNRAGHLPAGTAAAGSRMLLAMLFMHTVVFGQKENNTWAFGTKAGLDFNVAGGPGALVTAIDQWEGAAAVSDAATGQLLFYTDGNTVWNAQHLPMPGSPVGVPTYSTAQAALILPVPADAGRYYIFSLAERTGPASPDMGKLFYSVVDMSLNGGLGDIVAGQKRILLDTGLTEAMAATAVGDTACNTTYWLIAHTFLGNTFKAWHVTPSGIGAPVLSAAGGSSSNLQSGIIKTAPNGRKLTFHNQLAGAGALSLALFDFDPGTGAVSNPVAVSSRHFYGVCFSPDNSKLYAATQGGITGPSRLYQYDISSGMAAPIQASEADIGATGNRNDLQLGPDGKIYLGPQMSATMHRVNSPNLPGAACDFVPNAISLAPGTTRQLGLPNIIPVAAERNTITSAADTLICRDGDGYRPLTLTAPAGFSGRTWDDGSSAPARTVSGPGVYWVTSTDSASGCSIWADTFTVHAGPDLRFSLGADITTVFCGDTGSVVTLETGISGAAYRWQDGSMHPQYRVRGPGTYWAEVTKDGCTAADTVTVRYDTLSLDLGADRRLCRDDLGDVVLSVPSVPDGADIRWSTGSTAPSIRVTDTGLYWVQLQAQSCLLTDTLRIMREMCGCFVRTGNAFTPNGDGRNDVFRPVIEAGCPVKEYTLRVYNRFGQEVFRSSSPAQGWDGLQNGYPADVGTYFYELSLKGGTRGQEHYEKGDLTLIR